jgi:nicotinamide-nucleotide amidase
MSTHRKEVAAELIATLRARHQTVAVAESLTGGAVMAELISVPGASLAVRGGVVAYDTALKASLLGVPSALLDAHGPVHPEVAAAMAEGVRRLLIVNGHPADIGVATTGVAGPDPQGGAPVGRVYVAVADSQGTIVQKYDCAGDRATVRQSAVSGALELLAHRLTATP